MLSWWRRNRFSASSRHGGLNKSTMNIPSECRIASIGRDHAMILPHDANPKPDGIFGKDRYDFEHIPERLRVPGFLACERWIGADNPKISVATYELENADVVRSAAYNAIGNHARGGDNLSVWSKRVTARVKIPMRFEGEQILPDGGIAPKDAPALLLNAMSVTPEHEHEFNEWYNTEHIPALAAVPGTLCARRYRGTGAAAQRYLALYYLTSADVPSSTAWKAAANTPWTERMRPHFRHQLRIVSRRYRRCAP